MGQRQKRGVEWRPLERMQSIECVVYVSFTHSPRQWHATPAWQSLAIACTGRAMARYTLWPLLQRIAACPRRAARPGTQTSRHARIEALDVRSRMPCTRLQGDLPLPILTFYCCACGRLVLCLALPAHVPSSIRRSGPPASWPGRAGRHQGCSPESVRIRSGCRGRIRPGVVWDDCCVVCREARRHESRDALIHTRNSPALVCRLHRSTVVYTCSATPQHKATTGPGHGSRPVLLAGA